MVVPVAEVDGPEAVVTADVPEHLVVLPPHPEGGVVEEHLHQKGVIRAVM